MLSSWGWTLRRMLTCSISRKKASRRPYRNPGKPTQTNRRKSTTQIRSRTRWSLTIHLTRSTKRNSMRLKWRKWWKDSLVDQLLPQRIPVASRYSRRRVRLVFPRAQSLAPSKMTHWSKRKPKRKSTRRRARLRPNIAKASKKSTSILNCAKKS